MSRLDLQEVAASVQQLPSLPSVVLKVLQSFEQPDPDIDQLAQDIARDEGLTVRVLRLANSPFYGLQSRVGTLPDAMTVLGFRNVRAAVAGVAVMRCFADQMLKGIDINRFWAHGAMVGLASRVIAKHCGQSEELAFTAGLVHDIGILALMTRYQEPMAEVIAYRARHDCVQRQAEMDVLGVDHAQVGHALLKAWSFPQAICDAVAGHHQPDDFGALADVVHFADALSHVVYAIGNTGDAIESTVPPISEVAFRRLGITVAQLKSSLEEIVRDQDAARQALLG